MLIKKSGGKIYGADLTAAEKKALDMEIYRELAEHTRIHELEVEALVIREVRRHTGWGKIKLKRFYNDFAKDLDELVKHYEMTDSDTAWLCMRELKEEGFDIEQWHHELYPNEKYNSER